LRSSQTRSEPTERAPITIQNWLNISPAAAFGWSVFADIATKLIAPALNKDSRATIMGAKEFELAEKIAAVLDCAHEQTGEVRRRTRTAFLRLAAQADNWPLLWSNQFDDQLVGLCLPKIYPYPVLVRTAPGAVPGALSYGCQALVPNELPTATDFSCFRYVLPAYLQHMLQNRMQLTLKHADLQRAVLHDLHAWLEVQYGQTFNLAAALAQLRPPETAHHELMRALSHGLRRGAIALLPRARKRDQAGNYFLRRKTTWWLNQRAADGYLKTDKNVDLNWAAIIDLIAQERVFQGEEEIHNMPGILIDAAWCDQFYSETPTSAQELG
jgi:hypothetical protein